MSQFDFHVLLGVDMNRSCVSALADRVCAEQSSTIRPSGLAENLECDSNEDSLRWLPPPYVDQPKRPNRTHHKYTYNLIRAHTEAYLYSYLPKPIKAWNSLPNNISNRTAIESFRTNVRNHVHSRLIILKC